MTVDQLKCMYGESFRQEARGELRLLNLMVLSKSSSKGLSEALTRMKIQAFPPDEETDTSLEREEMKEILYKKLGKEKVDAGT